MNTMTYENYAARIEYSADDGCFVGHIAGISDIVGFHGESVEELRAAFIEAVEDYLGTCDVLERAAQESFVGNPIVRVPTEEQTATCMAAEGNSENLVSWVGDTLADAEIPMPGLLAGRY